MLRESWAQCGVGDKTATVGHGNLERDRMISAPHNLVRRSVLWMLLILPLAQAGAADPRFKFQPEDRICYIGNTLADRMQHHAWLETLIHDLHPQHRLIFRNLGFAGDEVQARPRSDNFGSPDAWLTKVGADVVFCFFGYNEALRGEAGLSAFEKNLGAMLAGMKRQKYNGKSAPRIVLFSPIAHENLNLPYLPDGVDNNKNLLRYTQVMQRVSNAEKVLFVDLFEPSLQRYESAKSKPLSMNGIHLLEHGNRILADVIVQDVLGVPGASSGNGQRLEKLRQAVLDKNLHWFSRYRVVDGYNVFGGRSKLNWFGQSNADVMRREMEIFDVMTANRDQRVWSVAAGGDLKIADKNLPKLLDVKTNKPGALPAGKHPYLSAQDSIGKMKMAEGMQVNVFASEEMFPELVNPVQMAVDTDGRLFVSVWPSYPHWNPTEPRTDRIVCLPDENRDGVADKCVIFADQLNSITGFEFWGGGVLVAAPPEIWFLKDTDGDDRADVKIRVLQGLSSADTHHSANALTIGPDGGLYWSRGIFNVSNIETPTGTFRSSRSGVYRFDPRTYEMSFVFPIGPNPHGDVFDQWGYQFANDGTSGTGSYVNIGNGVGNKQWFRKRVRPVSATGILSSSHFPQRHNGNFLICNCIGFLGVLQHEVRYNGADITAHEVEPILVSSDPNFRPTDIEIGGDGAIYVSDWCNVLIGHMQHNMRDPNRDHAHGRVYRVTVEGRPLLQPVKLKGKPVREVLQAFYAVENGVRYRARLELSGRNRDQVVSEVGRWAASLDPADAADAQALLECLWVLEEQRFVNLDLLARVFQAAEPRVRAAAIRTLGHWAGKVKAAESPLVAASRDAAALVRAEAVKAAVAFQGLGAAEVIFEVATRPTDPELDTVIKYAQGKINVDQVVQDAVESGRPLSSAAQRYVLRNASVTDLLKLERTEAVCLAILSRTGVPIDPLREALGSLARLRNALEPQLLMEVIEDRIAREPKSNLEGLGQLLLVQPTEALQKLLTRIELLATQGASQGTRQLGYAAWITASGSADDAYLAAVQSKGRLRDFLDAIPSVENATLRGSLYAKVRPLISELPGALAAEKGGASLQQHGLKVDYYYPSANNVARETLAKMTPVETGIATQITINVPQRKQADKFALRFSGSLYIPKAGRYTLFANSDDGSRIYIGDRMVVNNDGLHGMVEKSGSIDLPAGSHPITVTYFDNGGGDGLQVRWAGPGFQKQAIPLDRLTVQGGETLHDVAIRAFSEIPGHEREKVTDLTALVKAGRSRDSAIHALRAIPMKNWPAKEVRPLVDNLVGYLSEIPTEFRTGPAATAAMALARGLSGTLPAEEGQAIQERLANLDVRVIAVGTVPHRMIYDKERIVVQAGKPVEFRFSNSDNMPHNFAILQPGSLAEVGMLAEATARDPDAMARQYIPQSDQILLASRLLQSGQVQAMVFEVPTAPGVYPYVCTYPGHWRRMYGALYVVESLDEYRADPVAYVAANPLPLKDELLKFNTRSQEWKFADLVSNVKPLPGGRAFEVGKELFKVANCVACHRLNNVGQEFGPDLTKLDPKRQAAEHILQAILEPSKQIEDKFASYVFVMESGKLITGMIVSEKPEVVEIVIDPLAKGKPTRLSKDEIESRQKSAVSMMPKGLLNRLSREEILDLIAYVFSRGNAKHPLFEAHHHGN